MNISRISAVLAALSLVSVPVLAQGSLEGSWKLALGKKAPCDVSISADGGVTPASDCATPVAHWKSTANGVQLQTASGETYAVLKPKGASYEGTTFADARTVTLSR